MKKIFITALLITSAFIYAQENQPMNNSTSTKNGWKLAIGVNYRSFDQVTFKQIGEYANGSVTDIGFGNYLYKVADPTSQVFVDTILNDTVTLASASGSGEFNFDNGVGVVLKASKVFSQGDAIDWSFDLSLATAYTQSSHSVGATFTTFDFGDWNGSTDGNGDVTPGPYPPSAPVDGKTEGVSGNYAPSDPGTTASIKYDLNLGLYTLGAGVSAACDMGPVTVFMGGGPTLSVVDYDIDYSVFGIQKNSDSTRLRAGMYAELGLEVPVNEKWAVGISGRYDWIPVEVNTDLAEVELSGFSGQLFVSYQF